MDRMGGMDRRIVNLAVPALGALLVEPAYNLTDTAIVGHLGRTPLGGLAVSTAVLNLIVFGSGFLAMATAPRIAFLRGAGRPAEAVEAAAAAYWSAIVLGCVLGAAVALGAGPLASAAGAHGAVHAAAVTYLRLSAAGIPFVLCILAGNGEQRGLADTRTAFVITLSSNLVNLVVEVILVYGLGTGLAGSAIGTVLAQVTGAVLFLRVSPRGLSVRPPRGEVVRLASAGWVLVVRTLALLGALSGSTAVAARLGTTSLAGHQIALQVWLLLALSLDALAVPAQILVGEALGSGSTEAAERIARAVVRAGVRVGAVVGAIMAATAGVVPMLFSSDGAVRHAATTALVIGGVALPVTAVAFELDGVLLGAGDLRYLRRAMLVALAAFAPLAGAVLAEHRLGLAGLWGALAVWMAARAALLARRRPWE